MEERCTGHAAVLRACVLIRGHMPTMLAMALPTNLGMAGADALFHLRVVSHRMAGRLARPSRSEYIHMPCVVLEIIVSCLLYRSCREE